MARWTPGKKGKKATDIGALVVKLEGGAAFVDVQKSRVATPPRQMLQKVQEYLGANGYANLEAYIDEESNGFTVRIAPLAKK